MNILLSNDDGASAVGLARLHVGLRAFGKVSVVAPERDRSGASNSLTLDRPLRARELDNGFVAVDGTPTDCVHLALTGLLAAEPDVVVSGINAGANLGDDVLYSGTVAAAVEGRFLGHPAIAVSLVLDGGGHYDTAARVVARMLKRFSAHSIPAGTILNVNVPDLPYPELAGIGITRLGQRHKAEPVIRSSDPRGHTIYWVGPPGNEQDAGPGTDFHAVREGKVSVTPLTVDTTRYSAMQQVGDWVASMSLSARDADDV